MFRKLRFVVAVPALLILLTAGAVQARPITVSGASDGLLIQAWQLVSRHWTGTWIKEAEGMDPNGVKPHSPVVAPQGRGAHPNRGPVGR